MDEHDFPAFFRDLPDIDLDAPGISGKLLQAGQRQVVLFRLEPVGEIPPHRHGAQWGVVLEGRVQLTVEGRTRTYGPGESYYIPAGAEHSADFPTRALVLDFFDEPERYRSRPG